jgi:hypothetical protein
MISGKPVMLDTSITGSPASARLLAVPPVDTNSIPRETNLWAKGMSPVLSETESSARLTGSVIGASERI